MQRDGDLDEQLADTFPASDPSSATAPGSTRAVPEPAPHALVYRIVLERAAPTAFSPEGASPRAGRWSSASTSAIYASLSPACALLEFLAHLEDRPGQDLRLVVASLPLECVHAVDAPPPHWRERPYRPEVQRVGDEWVRERRSLALKVPSALMPREHNVLINPHHPDADRLALLSSDPVTVDSRLYLG
ncbi:RES domain-containing protein [Vulcaniibacterium tengchongense]|uniref:RES domain-containing protein n=1 Tax=Vulcaniibacterium tengchongense TaxID=1273429 RepID=A0A3N4V1S4_9GAMM|nr:RES domain-containing protein [Vulcaniibacterium tengchongense]